MKRCFWAVIVTVVMLCYLTACNARDNETSSSVVSSYTTSSSSSSSGILSSSSNVSEPEEIRPDIKKKIDDCYNFIVEAEEAQAKLTEKYGNLLKIPDSEVPKVNAELKDASNKLDEARSLLEELMGMRDLMNQTELNYFDDRREHIRRLLDT